MRILLLIFLLVGCSGSNSPVDYFAVETPRPFGYVLGDEITQRIIMHTRPGLELQTGSLPGKGQLTRWLNLNEVKVMQDGQHYEIELRYQVFYAALEVKALSLPGFGLQLVDHSQTVTQAVPAWEFTLSPLRELAVRKTEHGEYMRPDAQPFLLSNPLAWYIFYAGFTVLLTTASYLAYLYGFLPKLMRKALFKRTLGQLLKLSYKQMGQALSLIHHALNTLNRQPLFKNQLADFYLRYPEYRSINSELEWFFQYSNRYFFGNGLSANSDDFEKIKILCSHCRQIERGSR